MRVWIGIMILMLIACAVMASNAHKPFETTIDAQSPAAWPKYASAPTMPNTIICRPLLIGDQVPKPISRT